MPNALDDSLKIPTPRHTLQPRERFWNVSVIAAVMLGIIYGLFSWSQISTIGEFDPEKVYEKAERLIAA